MAAFLKAPFLLNASQIRAYHITALLALLLKAPLRSVAIGLICKSYSEGNATYIRSQWE